MQRAKVGWLCGLLLWYRKCFGEGPSDCCTSEVCIACVGLRRRSSLVKASTQWLEQSGGEWVGDAPRFGCALLTNYTAEYVEWGEGPPLVLVPALAGGVGLVSRLAGCLARHFRVISYQLRGEDDCFALRRHFGLDDLVDDLGEFIDCLGLERPIICGVSLGGVLAVEYAARRPLRVAGLVAQGVDVRFEPSLLREVAGRVLTGYPLPPDSPFVNQFFNLFFGGRQHNRVLFDFVTRQCWQTDQSVMAHRFRLAEQVNLAPKLGRIRAPTLLAAGERDVLISPRGLEELHAGIRGARLVRLPNAGHLAFVTHAQELADHIGVFTRWALAVEVA